MLTWQTLGLIISRQGLEFQDITVEFLKEFPPSVVEHKKTKQKKNTTK